MVTPPLTSALVLLPSVVAVNMETHDNFVNDTVIEGQNGFSFRGSSLQEKQLNLLTTLDDTLLLFNEQPEQWKKVSGAAAKARFTWDGSVQQYLAQLYRTT